LLVSSLLIVAGLTRVTLRPSRRGLMYWWVWAAFGLSLVDTALVAVGLVSSTDQVIAFAFNVPMLGLGLLVAGRAARRDGRLSMSALLCTAPIIISFAYVMGGGSVGTPVQAIVSMLVAIVLPADGYDPEEIIAGMVSSLRALAILLLLLVVAGVPTLIGECRADKCSLWGQQIGQAGNANGLGMAVAFVGVVVGWRLSWWRLVVVLVGVALLTDLSSSRSALLPLAFGLIAIVIERRTRGLVRTALRSVALVSVVGTIFVIGLWPWPPSSFTDRAGLWRHALALALERPWFGWGLSFWVRQPETTTLDANYSAHNMLLETLVSFGIVGLILIVVGLFVVSGTVRPDARSMWFVATVCLLGGGVTEVVATAGRFYLVPGAFILLFILSRGEAVKSVAQCSSRARVKSEVPISVE